MNLKQLPGAPVSLPRSELAAPSRAEAAPAAGLPAPAPAVSVKVSELAAGTVAMAASASSQAPLGDSELLQALRQRIQVDDFQIDYAGLAGALVETALQAVGSRRGR